ncbi:unnamed protein product [Orchesella dallaii]|uniref:Uncharacterized protein n=1 Tax=Orchesella dallaii TaxID=48710 RepID=A0ABP1QXS8_9HEXA
MSFSTIYSRGYCLKDLHCIFTSTRVWFTTSQQRGFFSLSQGGCSSHRDVPIMWGETQCYTRIRLPTLSDFGEISLGVGTHGVARRYMFKAWESFCTNCPVKDHHPEDLNLVMRKGSK